MKPARFLVKIVQMLDQQKVVHAPRVHGKHQAPVYTMVYLGVECIALNGRHEMLNQPRNRVMKANQQLDVRRIPYNLLERY